MAYGFGLQRDGNRRIAGLSPGRLPGPSANKSLYERPCLQGTELQRDDRRVQHEFQPGGSALPLRRCPLKDSGSAFLIKLSLVDFVGFGSSHYAACLVLVLGEFLPNKVGEEWFCPRGDDGHYYVGQRCYFIGRASDCVRMFGVGQCSWVRAVIVRLPFPYYGWLEQPFQEDVGGGTTSRFAPTRAKTSAA